MSRFALNQFDCIELQEVLTRVQLSLREELSAHAVAWWDWDFFLSEVQKTKGKSQHAASSYPGGFLAAPTGFEAVKGWSSGFGGLEKVNGLRNGDVLQWKGSGAHLTLLPVLCVRRKTPLGLWAVLNSKKDPTGWFQAGQQIWEVVQRVISFSYQHYEAKSLSYIDDLTGLYNQRFLTIALEKEIQRSRRTQGQFCVLFLDIDHFKRVNDTAGHLVGSQVLRNLGRTIKSNLRGSDFAFRYGGDEFLVVLVDADLATGQLVGNRLRSVVEAEPHKIGSRQVSITVSIGIACYPEHAQTPEAIVHLADQAMFYGKDHGRNIVAIAS